MAFTRLPISGSLVLASSLVGIFYLGCSAEPTPDPPGDTGGNGPVGGSSGAAGSAGQSGTGGTPGLGGNTSTGGAPTGGGPAGSANGGAGGSVSGSSSGGMAGSGGNISVGGAGGAGGMPGGSGGRPGGSGGMSGGRGGSGGGGAGGGSGGGSGDAMKSAGCGMSTTQMTARWVDSMVMSGGSNRPYATYLPTGYDSSRAYPVIVLLHGCGSGTNNPPMERETGANAILVRGTGSAADTCWNTSATGADVTFFDAMVADTKARFCTDTKRFFIVGYSSGSWLANQLGCIRADVIRAAGTVAGGNPGVRNCVGPFAHMFVHDTGDTSNTISGGISARDRLIMQNGCDMTTMPQDPSPCVRYQGCEPGYPVVWCQTTGQGHNRQDNLVVPAFWDFFQEF